MSISKKRIFITVKTYPNPSASYVETVCTAGIIENEGWIRLYPIPFRVSDEYKQFKKYQWITVDVVKRPASSSDRRPESFSPQAGTMELGNIVPSSSDVRKDIIFKNTRTYNDFEEIFKLAREFKISLATFNATQVLDFYAEPVKERDWTPEEQAKLRREFCQEDLFSDSHLRASNLRKLPYKFKFKLKDIKGKTSNMMIEDWEVGALYWNVYSSTKSEEQAVKAVIDRYTSIYKEQDCTFFLGTVNKNQNIKAPNPFVIIGLFHTKKTLQTVFSFE